MTPQRIAIIGCGYVGSALGEALCRAGHDVLGTTTAPSRVDDLRSRGITPEVVEVAELERLHELLSDRAVVYLTIAPGTRGADYRDVYLAGANAVLAAAGGTAVRRIVYTSSTHVYAQEDGGWVDETSPTEPKDENGWILLAAERALLDGAARLSPSTAGGAVTATVLRLSGIYGPGRDPVWRIRAASGTERTDGDTYLNLVHLDDILSALTALLDAPYHGVLNLSDDEPTRRRDYYDGVLEELDLPPIRWRQSDAERGLGKRVRNARIKKTLGLVLKHPTHVGR